MVDWLRANGITWVVIIGVVWAGGQYKESHDQKHRNVETQLAPAVEKNTEALGELTTIQRQLLKELKRSNKERNDGRTEGHSESR